jgi:adenylate kinase
MKIVLLGPPGAGKGTQAVRISEEYHIPHISTGDIFRKAFKEESEIGKKAKAYVDKGLLVPDEIVVDIVDDRLKQEDCIAGYLLDGFPRTLAQAVALDERETLDMVINIDVPIEQLIDRITGRRVCRNCGSTYHITTLPSKEEGKCDVCAGDLYQRDDDKIDTVTNRLNVYNTQTKPLIEYYQDKGILVTIDGQQDIEKVFLDIRNILGERMNDHSKI